ncbi:MULTISPECIES: RnfABCDGE type electron transport complex subunit G [Petrimonas]|jgi:electron transport complex protein RnfG|uniref:Ion-translocating oxidoreductase complex subunit G n=1 Tax=Petrimonas mucosa TaxID=1642646 RepID=A0A1G4G5U0_9BACT|nr:MULTISPECIES: RnfABCDGE type electron transport complex subunit G [Petrimonas]MDD3560263.1 RnfABCDGE type electron transport complex subunit G [Petrimonas mucosa]SCM56852.1 Electron transport complex subunit G {ECO:0000255/HAMAP-Rule:MF_00479} [Petrimonas mucosa]SFU38380.1 electron transport complex protein RnfG [Porphyromonadaceae bacterium KHP3R9]HHT30720.1 RnfABCDGE type electron transport complex subunit G [Petrimonas mucosa]
MAKLQSTFKNMFLSLFIITLVVATLLAQVNKMTAKPIAAAKALKLENAVKEVVPEFDNNPVAEAYMMATPDGDSLLVYPAKKGDELVGFAVNSYSNNGFSGNIQIMVGFDTEERVVNYTVLSHAETPGLGSKMSDWFRDSSKPNQLVIGRKLSEGKLAVSKDGGQIDAITASTITSRAFLEAINRAYQVYKQSDADSGATKQNKRDENQREEGGESHE